MRPEYVLGACQALLGIRIGKAQRSHRALDGAAERVVDANLLESRSAGIGNGLAGLRVEQSPRGGLVSDDMIGGIDHQAIVGERFQNCGGLRRRLGGQFADCGGCLRKLVVEKFRERVVDRVSAGDG